MNEIWTDHFSHSQLVSVEECPYAYYLLKAAGIKPVENAFAQAGQLAHELLAGWARGGIPKEQLPLLWEERFYRKVTVPFPHYLEQKGIYEKTCRSIAEYFASFDGFPGYEILGVEQEFTSSIAGNSFVGIIDLILRNKETGGIMLVDHKSASVSTFNKQKEKMYRQLLLYSKFIADNYGCFPETLCFNLFKEQKIDSRPFNQEDFIAARIWAESVIKEMRAKDVTEWFETKPDYFRCTNLCSARKECPFGKPENHCRKQIKLTGEKTTV